MIKSLERLLLEKYDESQCLRLPSPPKCDIRVDSLHQKCFAQCSGHATF